VDVGLCHISLQPLVAKLVGEGSRTNRRGERAARMRGPSDSTSLYPIRVAYAVGTCVWSSR
jgi:hypothetical protein